MGIPALFVLNTVSNFLGFTISILQHITLNPKPENHSLSSQRVGHALQNYLEDHEF